jgi:hypothetical protein
MQQDLFNLNPITPKKPEPGMRCRNCEHIYKHNYGKMFYCGKQQSNRRTAYGDKKIKANDAACPMFEKKENYGK